MKDQMFDELTELVGDRLELLTELHGSSSAQSYLMKGASGDRYFVKYDDDQVGRLAAEVNGLDWIRKSESFRVPAIYQATDRYLVLEYIESGRQDKLDSKFWQSFAQSLVRLHHFQASYWGLDCDNFIGRSKQINQVAANTWADFFLKARLFPQLDWFSKNGYFSKILIGERSRLIEKVGIALKAVAEPAVLIHGDLWSGNFLADCSGKPVLIDPAVYFAHREAEFSIMKLFGGFDQSLWVEYQKMMPFEQGFELRLEIYTLYHLLNHCNIFGQSYLGDCEACGIRILQS